MQIISNIALISINETLIFQVVSFLIFLFIINRIMFRPLRQVMDDRENYIETVQQDILEAENQLDDLTNQIQQQEKAVRDEAFEQQQLLEASGSRQAAEILASTRKEINALKDKTRKEVNDRISEARKDAQKESVELAQKIIETVLDRRLHS